MKDTVQNYFEKCETFFGGLIERKHDEAFVDAVRSRIDKIARDLCLATDDHVTDILKGQLSICYELVDGVEQARSARDDEATSERGELSLGIPFDES